MKTFDYVMIIVAVAWFCLLSTSYVEDRITDSETRIIEAIKTKNDSINAVQFLNREK